MGNTCCCGDRDKPP